MGASHRGTATAGYLIFDIETRVDKELVRDVLYPSESAEGAYERMRDSLADQGGFFPLSFHVPISIAIARVGADRTPQRLDVLRADEHGEDGIVRRFWSTLEAFDGTLVSFSGRAFDLPVLELQGLRHGCAAPRYFADRDGLRARFGRHHDLYDFLTNRGAARLRGGLDLVAKLVGLPGKGAVSGADVQQLWEEGRSDLIHAYCRADVIQTYFVFLHVELLRGAIDAARLAELLAAARPWRDEVVGGTPA
jgi:predicted PolB exonuclease-like 3'-5' exonuclease